MFDQLAIVTNNIERDVKRAQSAGLKDWVRDVVTADAEVGGQPVEFKAKLAFNYDAFNGVEFELIEPVTAKHYIAVTGAKPGQVAHAGIHVNEEADMERLVDRLSLKTILQDCRTTAHANPAVPEGRTYHYQIWWTPLFQFPVKLIQRLG